MTEAADPALDGLVEVVARIAETLRAGDDDAARARAATEVAQLQALVAQHPPGAAAELELAQLGDALRVLGTWLRAPTDEHEAAAERVISDLQATLGPRVGWDPSRDDAARRAQYRREARATLDDIFRDKPKP